MKWSVGIVLLLFPAFGFADAHSDPLDLRIKTHKEAVSKLKELGLWMPDAKDEAEMDAVAQRWAEVFNRISAYQAISLPEEVQKAMIEAWDLGPTSNTDFDRVNLIWEYVLPKMRYGVRDVPSDIAMSRYRVVIPLFIIVATFFAQAYWGNLLIAVAHSGALAFLQSLALKVSFAKEKDFWGKLNFSDSSRTKRLSQILDSVSVQHGDALRGFSKIVNATVNTQDLRFRQPLLAMVRKCLY